MMCDSGERATEVAPRRGKGPGAVQRAFCGKAGGEDPDEGAPHPPAAAGWGRAGPQPGLGVAGRDPAASRPLPPSVTFQRLRGASAPLFPCSPRATKAAAAAPQAAQRPVSLTCPRRRPRPALGAARVPPGVGCPGPCSLPKLPGCPSHRLSGGEGRGCVGPRGAEELRSLHGLSSAPFPPQRVVAAARAPRLFYKRERALPRRAGASAGGSARALREGLGNAQAERRGRGSRLLATRPPSGKGRTIPEGAEAAMQGKRKIM
ncbi:uncharacterized protein LOC118151378 [Callithrix jacchus]|uniref:sterile alpha motif domain-containing protein 1-like n=1 Tax=Callithrix jacchus TaxID=9483 RepID=UPI00159E6178|nr:sterile alpha motif domain-containing protein 1-like [Callithrix jacchus]